MSTYLHDFCMGKYLIRKYLSNFSMGTSVGIHQFTNFQYRDRKKVTIRLTESTQKVDE